MSTTETIRAVRRGHHATTDFHLSSGLERVLRISLFLALGLASQRGIGAISLRTSLGVMLGVWVPSMVPVSDVRRLMLAAYHMCVLLNLHKIFITIINILFVFTSFSTPTELSISIDDSRK